MMQGSPARNTLQHYTIDLTTNDVDVEHLNMNLTYKCCNYRFNIDLYRAIKSLSLLKACFAIIDISIYSQPTTL